MKARDLMSAHPRVVEPADTVSDAAAVMRDRDVGMVPVVDERTHMRLRGVITDRDIATRHVAERHEGDCEVRDHMSAGPLATVSPEADVEEVMRVMRERQVRRVLVTEGERLVGVIAQADLARREGPLAPVEVEKVLERISEPWREPALA